MLSRIIIKESDLENELERLKEKIFKILEKYNLTQIQDIEIKFDNEACNDYYVPANRLVQWLRRKLHITENFNCYNEILIKIYLADNDWAYMTYATESRIPQLVFENGKYEFYYIFEWVQSTATSSKDYINIAFSEYKDALTIEDIIDKELTNI
jgi:hypothetical protein